MNALGEEEDRGAQTGQEKKLLQRITALLRADKITPINVVSPFIYQDAEGRRILSFDISDNPITNDGEATEWKIRATLKRVGVNA